jgi:predicted DNA-binding ArsR family transcriptional regulator
VKCECLHILDRHAIGLLKKIKIIELRVTVGNDHAARKNEYSASVKEVALRRFTRFACLAKLTIMRTEL